MSNPHILIIDDETEILEMITLFLERENYDVTCLQEGDQVVETVKLIHPELIIMDILLPDIDGVELCRQIRKFSDAPIVFISCKGEDMDKVIGLSAGGDDYITKPFSPMELVARVKAHLRRNQLISRNPQAQSPPQMMKFNELEINLMMQEVLKAGSRIALSAREFKLLTQLARHPGRIYTTDELYELVWGEDSFSDTRTIMVHISNLRKKLEFDPANPEYILTIRGAGYKFNEKHIKAM